MQSKLRREQHASSADSISGAHEVSSDKVVKSAVVPKAANQGSLPEPVTEKDEADDDVAAMPLPVPSAFSTDEITAYLSHINSTRGYQLLLGLLNQCYRQRKQPDILAWGAGLLPRFNQEVSLLKQQDKAALVGVGHMQLATLLADSGHYSEAIAVCVDAQTLGLKDGTVTGFEGRLTRIRRAQAKAR